MTVIHGFELLKEQHIPELNTKARLFRHMRTDAQLLSMENDDENKSFGINFYTPPTDSTGLPHILEHSVLNGSRKYPIKEPFVQLIKGSLNTFVNAFTFADKTCYPLASQNLQDFHNLIDVYMDAVFFPRITPQTLQQEGWHYELENVDDPLVFKGVVFNEMKGTYSSPDSVLGTEVQKSLFPDNHYGVDSGGDPRVIPNLTYEQFKKFHETYYHPSNALIYFYGDDEPNARLRLMDNYLKDFEPLSIDKRMILQPRFDQPRKLVVGYDASEDDDSGNKGMVAVNWVLTETDEIELSYGLKILSHILIGTPASPLRKALIDSDLGETVIENGIDDQIAQMTFSTGLKGIAAEDAEKVEALIFETLELLAREGIESDMIEASLNTIEFELRESNTGQFPRGLALMIGALSTWTYGGDPLAPLAFEKPLEAIKGRIAAGDRYFEGLIQQYLLDNAHRSTVVLEPDPNVRQREEAAEKERLEKARTAMTQDDLLRVIEDTRALKLAQETPDSAEALATLPMLKRSDLDLKNKQIPIHISDSDGARIVYHDLFTNGIVYLDVGFNLHLLPQQYLPYIGLFSRALLEMGTQTEDFVKLSQRIGRKTGGIDTSTFSSLVQRSEHGTAWLFLRAKSTVAQVDDLLDILRDVLLTVNLDNRERFRQMVLEEKSERESGIVPGGHVVANTRLRAHFNEANWANEQMNGISALFFIRSLVDKIDQDWASVRADLEAILAILLNRNSIVCNVTLDAANWETTQPKIASFLASLPADISEVASWSPEPPPVFEGLTIPAQVNYVGKGANLYELGYELHGSQAVIVKLLATSWLWEKIRVQGGAYGGFCAFDPRTGVLTFLSYRDPNLLGTLDNFDGTAKYLYELEIDEDELTRGIIGAIGDVDTYLLPDAKGYASLVRYLVGETDEERQRLRDEILATSPDDFRNFALALQKLNEAGHITVVGSQEAIENANAKREGLLTVTKVL